MPLRTLIGTADQQNWDVHSQRNPIFTLRNSRGKAGKEGWLVGNWSVNGVLNGVQHSTYVTAAAFLYRILRFQICASEDHSLSIHLMKLYLQSLFLFTLKRLAELSFSNRIIETHQDWWTSRPHQHRRARCRCPASTSWRPSRWAASRPPRPAAAAYPGICTK